MDSFDGTISEETLCFYLSRAVSYCDALATTSLEDDLRLLGMLKPCFIGRASFPWEPTPWTPAEDAGKGGSDFEELQFARAQNLTARIHAILPNAICQAVVWEGIFPSINTIPIPAWVFADLDQTPENRCFRYDDMFGADFEAFYRWDEFGLGCQVFDLTKPESQRWLYYRACRCIDAGFEAIHMGQPHLYAAKDHEYTLLDTLFTRIRAYAKRHARRRLVLLDAHTHGIARQGHLLFDFHSRPLSARAWREYPERIVLHLKGTSLGGITPSGWSCASLPYLIEIDNWGGYSLDPAEWDNLDKRAASGRWGWDDISWFAHQNAADRSHFLQYAHRWTRLQNWASYFQMPVRRTLDRAALQMVGYDGSRRMIDKYHANQPSLAAPFGFGDEEAIGRIWEEKDPEWLTDWHNCVQNAVTRPRNSDIPQPVVIVGELQRVLGGIPGESMCPFSRMVPTGNDTFELALIIPWKGTYTFSISVGGTMTDVTRAGGFAGGNPYVIHTTRDNERVRLRYAHWRRRLTAVDDQDKSVLTV